MKMAMRLLGVRARRTDDGRVTWKLHRSWKARLMYAGVEHCTYTIYNQAWFNIAWVSLAQKRPRYSMKRQWLAITQEVRAPLAVDYTFWMNESKRLKPEEPEPGNEPVSWMKAFLALKRQ